LADQWNLKRNSEAEEPEETLFFVSDVELRESSPHSPSLVLLNIQVHAYDTYNGAENVEEDSAETMRRKPEDHVHSME